MGFKEIQGIRKYVFEIFPEKEIIQGIYTRHGGVSPAPWNTLNLGGLNGDPRENVIENRRRIFAAEGRSVESIYDAWQVHGTHVICTDAPRPLDQLHEKADAIVTDRPEITLFMRFADCVPILLYEPKKRVAALIHAGWRGTVDQIARVTVETMRARYQCAPKDVLAGIGPSIGLDEYPVGEEVILAVKSSFRDQANELLHPRGTQTHFDLWSANRLALEMAGVEQIQISGISTAANTNDWFSHRAEAGATGRFGAMIALR